MKTRILLLFLAGVLLLLPLTGCNNSSNDPKETTPLEDENDVSYDDGKYDSEGYLKDDLPDNLNYNSEIRVLHWTEADIGEFDPDEDTKFAIDKAIWERDRAVEDRLGIIFEWIPTKGHWSSENSFVTTVQNAMNGGEEMRYDIIATYSQSAALISTRGFVLNLKENGYLDWEKPWWPKSLTDSFTINDQLFFASGDISTTFLSQMIGVYFNKEFFLDQNLYDLVYNNEWTVDKMMAMAKELGSDIDTEVGKSQGDQYGVICPWEIYLDGFFYGSNLITVDKDSDGALRVSGSYIGERADTLAEKLKTLFHASDDGYLTNAADPIRIFSEGRSAFMVAPGVTVLTTQHLQDTDVDYGILPMPKYDSTQKEYKTVCTNLISLYCIFAGNNEEQTERAGAVLECMASEGYRQISPVLFNQCLQLRYAKDGDTGKMFDLIRDGVVFDIGRVYGRTALNDITQAKWQRCVIDGNKVWGAQSASVDAQMQNLLDKLQASFDARG
ncbi:MAG: hypothetical protein IJZ80_01160 [Clostridia bacterium]|nr:hypothetical protein [Clostridia bacterium]